jgi:hypothetical protein
MSKPILENDALVTFRNRINSLLPIIDACNEKLTPKRQELIVSLDEEAMKTYHAHCKVLVQNICDGYLVPMLEDVYADYELKNKIVKGIAS